MKRDMSEPFTLTRAFCDALLAIALGLATAARERRAPPPASMLSSSLTWNYRRAVSRPVPPAS